jgi:hypothetical protein
MEESGCLHLVWSAGVSTGTELERRLTAYRSGLAWISQYGNTTSGYETASDFGAEMINELNLGSLIGKVLHSEICFWPLSD